MKEKEKEMPIPLTEGERLILMLGFLQVQLLLADTDNPLTAALLRKILTGKDGVASVTALMDGFIKKTEKQEWTLKPMDLLPYYMLVDLVVRIHRSGYNAVLENRHGNGLTKSATEEKLHPIMLEVSGNIRQNMLGLRGIPQVAWYMWRAERLPDPVTGVSPVMAKYNHLPVVPKNPPQLVFSDLGDDDLIEYRLKDNMKDFMFNYSFVRAIYIVLNDEENPPAKIILAYFPNMSRELYALMTRFSDILKKKRRTAKIILSVCEFSLLYACADLFGRLSASSYRHILPEIEKNDMYNPKKEATASESFDNVKFMSVMTAVVDDVLVRMNRDFSDSDAIKAYRKVAMEMVWFDD